MIPPDEPKICWRHHEGYEIYAFKEQYHLFDTVNREIAVFGDFNAARNYFREEFDTST